MFCRQRLPTFEEHSQSERDREKRQKTHDGRFLSVVYQELYVKLGVFVHGMHAQERGLGLKEFAYAVEDASES